MAFGKKTEKVKGPKLGFGRLLAWKSSDVASAACFVIVNTYLSIYCTNYIGIEAAALGTILLVSNVIDAITDLIGCYMIITPRSPSGARPVLTSWASSVSGSVRF